MRRASLRSIALVAVAMAFTASAVAQTVYRCGPEGRSYSQQPCAEGKPVRVDDARSDMQRRDAETAAERDARAARTLERERLAVKPDQSGAVGFDSRGRAPAEPAPVALPAAKKKKYPKTRPPDDGFRAAVPKPAKKAAPKSAQQAAPAARG